MKLIIKSASSEVKQCEINITKLDESRKEQINLQTQIENLNTFNNIISKYINLINYKNLPQDLVISKLKAIERYANILLSTLSNLNIRFETSKKIEIVIQKSSASARHVVTKDETSAGEPHVARYKEYDYVQCSGFELFIIELALKQALSKYTFTSKSNIFAIDEGWDVISKANLKKIPKIFNYLRQQYDNILIISHQKSLHKYTDNAIYVNKHDYGSYITYEKDILNSS
jgi:DNA repair exonuclease SbcCD ATPase subunit